MMARPRSGKHRQFPDNLYERKGYFSWRDPRTGKEYGLGRDKRSAFDQAIEANLQAIREGRLPKAPQIRLVSGKESAGRVPDVKCLGLSDAIYSLESCGYSCSYEGHGTVVSQDPAPNSARSRGSKVHLRLK